MIDRQRDNLKVNYSAFIHTSDICNLLIHLNQKPYKRTIGDV